jgi:hypothetical protein
MSQYIIFFAAVALIVGTLGYMNGNDIADCVARGHSEATCQHAINR